MSATSVTGAPRQSAVLTAVAGLHVGAFILFASGLVPRVLDVLPAPRDIFVVQRIPEPVVRVQPGLPMPADYVPLRAPLPDLDIPRVDEEAPAVDAIPVTDASAAGGSSSGQEADFQPPALQMRDSRLAALVDACYPSGARRIGEEGRAVARIVVSADGRVASWTKMQGSGFPRLDAALGCVIRRLQFIPGRRDGRAIVAEVQLPIVFQLH
jgi:periplasmic protein TonB